MLLNGKIAVITAPVVPSAAPQPGPSRVKGRGMAVFAASDRASGLTGTTVNLTMGSLDD